LVRINLVHPKPKPELVGRFDGFTAAKGTIDDQLVLIGASPAAFVKGETGSWGVGLLDRAKTEFSFRVLGQGLQSVTPLTARLALAMEDTGYGKTRIARIDLVTGSRRDLAELAGAPAFVDAEAPPLVTVATNLGVALRNLETGVQMTLPDKPNVRRTEAGILVWTQGKPDTCSLYSPERFLKLASLVKVTEKKRGEPKAIEQSKPTKRIPPN
jgi:hypothetical protein